MAGPSQWGQDTRESILEQLASGMSLRTICEAPNMPSEALVRKWSRSEPDFGAQYARAREDGMDAMADELLAIADDTANDFKTTVDGKEIVDQEAIACARLRVDARKWIMSKIAPKKYGEKITQEVTTTSYVAMLPDVVPSTDEWLKKHQK